MNQISIAVQMYTLRDESNKDFVGTLEKVAELGFQGVEFAGYGDIHPGELRKRMDEFGLRTASSHVPIHDLASDIEQVIHDQQILGSNYVVCPYIEERSEADYVSLIHTLNAAGEKCYRAGISLCYHNHDFELERLGDGRTALQTILDETNPKWVKAEFDIYWLTYAGENPVEWMNRYKGRTPVVHLKDMTTDGEKFFAELGTGGVDIYSVLALGESSGVDWWIVEQDECRKDPFISVSESMNFLKKHRESI
ncbi:sugar phosphate isomerase/epimerase [Bacillus sp. CECT 9360]|uniref:sugar phosphate isomerase/epimerase family protein n=1 Tax=Bacillus sp. CECT 9360 TaxID=2845821 RepID=UPI001E561A61|nr:sugar phosphate isomerase/epimerase [Bacillus sp. CECT 9360]CAH0346045.1 Inosose dehydratase [Bacillus sp. CECT 9360]